MIRSRFKSSGFVDGLKKDIRFLKTRQSSVIGLFAPFFAGILLLLLICTAYWQFDTPVMISKIN
jgi:hypothetical protein